MNYALLTETSLFEGITGAEAKTVLQCLFAYTKKYRKDEIIYRTGDRIKELGLVLSGRIHIENNDVWGNRTILDSLEPGQVFAETYACVPGEPLMVNAVADADTEILFLNVERLLSASSPDCACRNRLIRNLLSVTAGKNLTLSRKIFHTAPKSIRGKLLAYLSFQAVRRGSLSFEIPFDRQQLADYLGVDRSALSKGLCRLQKEGLLTFRKNHFCLHALTPDSPSGRN